MVPKILFLTVESNKKNWNWNSLFYLDKIVKKERKNMYDMVNTSSNSYQLLCLIKLNVPSPKRKMNK